MGNLKILFCYTVLVTLLDINDGCQMNGLINWAVPVSDSILDTFRGTVFNRTVSDIDGINNIGYGDTMIGGPYFDIALDGTQFVIQTNSAYENYEEIETSSLIHVTIDFACTTGNPSRRLILTISVNDTNNHAPQFIPTNEMEFVVTPPLPPGFSITGCLSDIIVRDIDLTTQRIDFNISNTDFEIEYDAVSSTTPKEFRAVIRTATFIRSLPAPITLTITATDVDLTDDPPLIATATVRILGDSGFELPQELEFGQSFYIGNYIDENELSMLEPIYLRAGYDEYVNFTLSGDYSSYFTLNVNDNQVSVSVVEALPSEVLSQRQIFLILRADREYTSGASATIIVQFPEGETLQFERAIYEGTLTNLSLAVPPLVLSQGYELATISVNVVGEYSTYFSAIVQGNEIILILVSMPDEVIENNSYISIQVVASSSISGNTSTIVNLEILKDDNITPVFDNTIYVGTYDPILGLIIEPIAFVQGFDDTVNLNLLGEYSDYFQLYKNESVIHLSSSTIPPELYVEQNIYLTIRATKPRTVGANAVVVISLPTARKLYFEENSYRGTIEGNELSIHTIILSKGYEEGVNFTLNGELSDYFIVTNAQDQVHIALRTSLPDMVNTQNSIIILTLTASGFNAITATTSLILDIIKEDTTTPVFHKYIYYGTYVEPSYIVIETINLTQGYETGVSFRLEGENSHYFNISNDENNVEIVLQSLIPEDIIFNEKIFLFNVIAEKPLTVGAAATILITFPAELTESTAMRFSQNTYVGTLQESEITLENMVLGTGFATGTEFLLSGDYAEHFSLAITNEVIQIYSLNSLPSEVITNNTFIALDIEARRPRAITTSSTVVLEILKQDVTNPVFSQAYYRGVYEDELVFKESIHLIEGFDETVTFEISGAHWFSLVQEGNNATLVLKTNIPEDILEAKNQLLFTIVANKPNANIGITVISIDLPKSNCSVSLENYLRFTNTFYIGYIEGSVLRLNDIILEGYTTSVNYTLEGDYSDYFQLSSQNGSFSLQVENQLPTEVINNNVLILELIAVNAYTKAYTIIIIEVFRQNNEIELEFEDPYYVGSYSVTEGLLIDSDIRLMQDTSDTNTTFRLIGEHAQWFGLERGDHSVRVIVTDTIPSDVIQNNQHLIFVVAAETNNNGFARATIIVSLSEVTETEPVSSFESVLFDGIIQDGVVTHETIVVTGFLGTSVELYGEYSSQFEADYSNGSVTITASSSLILPTNVTHLALELRAGVASAVLLLRIINTATELEPVANFEKVLFEGFIQNGTVNHETIIVNGFSGTNVDLYGEYSSQFEASYSNGFITITALSSLVLPTNITHLALEVRAGTASAVALLRIVNTATDTSFEKVLFEGILQNGIVNHEPIVVTGFSGTDVDLYGEYSSQFDTDYSYGFVTITASSSLVLPTNITHLALELRAGAASAVLLLQIINTVTPSMPLVTFTSSLYTIGVESTRTGLVGRVEASADNGEEILYSLLLEDAHLRERLSINSVGELHLSAPVNSGEYSCQVVATTVFSQATATATINLSVEDAITCVDELVMNPLIVLNGDEEEPHYNLISVSQYENCQFTLRNRWPLNQSWLYVDDVGLHTTAIDREHESIAFMALSQVQVELTLLCDGDNATRTKRSLTDTLGPYDYGNNKWILTETISFNPRRSLVNLIVNDINDNAPIFSGKENEPLIVGYPVPSLEELILPRSLIELQATDADIGENAALLYWSSASELAVAPTTGFVHVRNGVTLENDARLTVNATDRLGDGLTGSIDILVKLLDEGNIAVITVREAFLDDEKTVLSALTNVLGYDVKVLRAVVISDAFDINEEDASNNRNIASSYGASLQMYIYGLIEQEPVSVSQLINDISNIALAPVNIASMVSLEDHLEGQEICVIARRDTGLLVATIVLSVLLLSIILVIAIWLLLRWKRKNNYDQFSDTNSLASQNKSTDDVPKLEDVSNSRLKIRALKESEKRLQKMLDIPIQSVAEEPVQSMNETILDIPISEANVPIVIQSIDKLKDAAESDDEFGEDVKPKRKSVVTFNENVEKIIHLEDNLSTNDSEDIDDDTPEFITYKL